MLRVVDVSGLAARWSARVVLFSLWSFASGCVYALSAPPPRPSPNLFVHAKLDIPFSLELHDVPGGPVCAKGLESVGATFPWINASVCVEQFRDSLSESLNDVLARMMPRGPRGSGMVANFKLLDFGVQASETSALFSMRYQFWLLDPAGRVRVEVAEKTVGREKYIHGMNLGRVISELFNGVIEHIGGVVDRRLLELTAAEQDAIVAQWQAQRAKPLASSAAAVE